MACCSCHVAFLRKFLAGKKKKLCKNFFFLNGHFPSCIHLRTWKAGTEGACLPGTTVWRRKWCGHHKPGEPTSAKRILSSRVASLPLTSYTLRSSLTASTYLAGQHGRIITLLQIDNIRSSQILTSQHRHFILKPVLNWVKRLFAEHISDSTTNYDSFLN